MNAWAGQFNMNTIDTNTGGAGPFAPREGWTGTGEEYRAMLRQQYRQPHIKQQMYIAARWGGVPTGPYADQAAAVIRAILEAGKRHGWKKTQGQ